MWRDQSRSAQAPPTDSGAVRVPDDEYRAALTATGIRAPAIDWSIANLPAYRTTPHKESGGRFYGGFQPDVGRVEINNDIPAGSQFNEAMHHEVWHGGQYAYRTPDTPFPPFQNDVEGERADFNALSNQSTFPDARMAARDILSISKDAYHYPIDLDNRFDHDPTHVPPWYADRRMPMQVYGPLPGREPSSPGPYVPPTATAVSVGTNPFGPTPPPPASKHRIFLPLATRG